MSHLNLQVIATLNHFAPEALLRNEYNQGSDVWSIAVLMWEMMSVGKNINIIPMLLELFSLHSLFYDQSA